MLSLRFAYDYTPFYFMEHIYNEVIKNYDDGKRRLLGFFFQIFLRLYVAFQENEGQTFHLNVFVCKQWKCIRIYLSRPPTGMSQSPYHILC